VLTFLETVDCLTDRIQRTESVFNEARYSETSATYAAAYGNCFRGLITNLK